MSNRPDLTSDAAVAIMREFAFMASSELLRKATVEFERDGPLSPRGAAIWDAGTWLWEQAVDDAIASRGYLETAGPLTYGTGGNAP